MRYFPVHQTEPEPTPTPVRDLTFTINDGTNAITGASVTIGETTETTDSNGECTLEDIEDGTYSVTVSAEGYTSETESITVDETHTSFTVSLTAETPTYDLSFTINDGTNAIEGATVAIGETTGTTGAAGGCTLREIEEGTQTVTVTATGYTTKTESITVDETHTSFTVSLTEE